jgi:FHA domain-containing protein
MKIAVISMRGGAGGGGLAAEFDDGGGSIGRASSNLLVLDDPDRTVSRVHAQVLSRNGAFFIIDRGSNPLSHNGVSLGWGKEAPLANGDRLHIGSFELAVSDVNNGGGTSLLDDLPTGVGKSSIAQDDADDPFADLLSGLAPAPAAAAKVTAAPAAPSFFPDPMGLDTASLKPATFDPFGDLIDLERNGGSATAGGGGGSNGGSNGGVFDGLPNASSSSIDDLFGLGSSTGGSDPLALSPLASPLFQPNTASSADPLDALMGNGPKATMASRSDHVPLLQQAFSLPAASTPKPAQAPAPFSPAGIADAVTAPSIKTPPKVQPAQAVAAQAGTATDSELLAAFLRGVKSTHQMPTKLTPELMERMGAMLHTATHGTLQLLQSRQEFKRTVHSEVTMIVATANNPLKFSPTVEVALAHMLGPKIGGFMGAEDAMNNAYADLRAHQFGVMVGMRAALSHVLGLFTPDQLEKRLTQKSKLDEIFSASRKAKLWDQFCKLYAGIATEAEDDFHTLFGKAFATAYDEQMARFHSDQ